MTEKRLLFVLAIIAVCLACHIHVNGNEDH